MLYVRTLLSTLVVLVFLGSCRHAQVQATRSGFRYYNSLEDCMYMAYASKTGQIGAYQTNKDRTTRFWLENIGHNKVTLTSPSDYYVCVHGNNNKVSATRYSGSNRRDPRCQFEEIRAGVANLVSIRAYNGKYVCPVEPTKYLYATANSPCYYKARST